MADAAFMNCSDGQTKLPSLVRSLTDCDRRRSYYLAIATCYCTPQSLRDFIDAVRAEVRLAGIHLYVDRRTAMSIGQEALAELEKSYPDLLWICAVRAGRLFHTKGFCLAAYNGENELVHGRLAIGSANLTNPGLTERHGNVETLAVHSDIATIEEFLEFFDKDGPLLPLGELTEFSQDDTTDYTDFKYALLTCGVFSHKWSPTLTPYFSARYRLNEEGKRRAKEGINTPGFQMEAATIAKSYFAFDLTSWRPADKGLIRKFGIECFLGHWIPKSALEGDAEDNELFDRFRSALFAQLKSKMESICREILQDCNRLIEEGIIDKPDADPALSFQGKVASLKDDPDKLRRIWSGRSFFQLPYDPGDVDRIEETFDDILLTALGSRRKNRSMRAFLNAEEEKTLEPLQYL